MLNIESSSFSLPMRPPRLNNANLLTCSCIVLIAYKTIVSLLDNSLFIISNKLF